jgi:hypothetical protein
MHQPESFYNFSNVCAHFLSTLPTNKPLNYCQAKIVAYYCKEILAMVESSIDTEPADGNTNVVHVSREVPYKRHPE